jgi:hypothetical protein
MQYEAKMIYLLFWVVTECSSETDISVEHIATCFSWFLLGLHFNPKDGGNLLLPAPAGLLYNPEHGGDIFL